MTPERWQRVKELFHDALERPADERAAFLAEACRDDAEARAALERLLDAHARADDFLETPAVGTAVEPSRPPLTGRVIGGWYLSGATLQWMLSRTRHVEIARVGILGTIGVTTLQLLGALLNNNHFDGPAWAVTLYLAYAALLGVVALWSWSPALTRGEPAGDEQPLSSPD